MLKKSLRLARIDFPDVITKGKTYHSSFFYIRAKKSPKIKISCVIPKKVAKNAVDRNSIKRKVTPIIKEYLKEHADLSFSVAIFAKKGVTGLPSSIIKKEILQIMASLS